MDERALGAIVAIAAAALLALFLARFVEFPSPMRMSPKGDAPKADIEARALQFQSGLESVEKVRQDFQLFPRPVATISFKAETIVPKSPTPTPRPQPVERERPRDVCARDGGHRIEFTRRHRAMWRCVYRKYRRGD